MSAATTGWKIRRVVWAAVESTIFRYSFHTMYGWRAMLLRMFGAKIGPRCRIRRTVRVYYPWNLRMGSMCIVGDEAELYSLARITLADRVMISQEAYVCAGTHDYTDVSLPLVTRPIEIGPDAWVCARAFVGPGVKIGEGAVVAACGVVTKEVRSWMIVGGNPAREIKQRQLRSAAPVRGGPQLSGEAAD
ncbi:MAG TPA: WcaF family extracellular polysaccharide biosynthesis acetyltransferase [Phycisphaerae bacterium]|nr:WcaF family extracellular polysaccharide biosynthesis acetyltransferase [Phycisphaerae bacterium]